MITVVTFSVKPEDKQSQIEVKSLKSYSKKTGISFSYLMLRAVKLLNEELKSK